MFEQKIVAAAAALLMSATLVGTVEAYPIDARGGTSTVTGMYRPIDLNLNVVESYSYTVDSEVITESSRLTFTQNSGGTSFGLSLVYSGSYTANYAGFADPRDAGYWHYDVSYADGYGGFLVTGSDNDLEGYFEIAVETDPTAGPFNPNPSGVGSKFGRLTYLGGGNYPVGLPAADRPSVGDYFEFYTTVAGIVMRSRGSFPEDEGGWFTLGLEQQLKHLGPFGSPLHVDQTNLDCFTNRVPVLDSAGNPENAIPCGTATYRAASDPNAFAVPEPASLALVGLGLVALALGRRRQRRT